MSSTSAAHLGSAAAQLSVKGSSFSAAALASRCSSCHSRRSIRHSARYAARVFQNSFSRASRGWLAYHSAIACSSLSATRPYITQWRWWRRPSSVTRRRRRRPGLRLLCVADVGEVNLGAWAAKPPRRRFVGAGGLDGRWERLEVDVPGADLGGEDLAWPCAYAAVPGVASASWWHGGGDAEARWADSVRARAEEKRLEGRVSILCDGRGAGYIPPRVPFWSARGTLSYTLECAKCHVRDFIVSVGAREMSRSR